MMRAHQKKFKNCCIRTILIKKGHCFYANLTSRDNRPALQTCSHHMASYNVVSDACASLALNVLRQWSPFRDSHFPQKVGHRFISQEIVVCRPF